MEKPWPGGRCSISPCRVKWSPGFAPHRMRSLGEQITSTRRSYSWKVSFELSERSCGMVVVAVKTLLGNRTAGLKGFHCWQQRDNRVESYVSDRTVSRQER